MNKTLRFFLAALVLAILLPTMALAAYDRGGLIALTDNIKLADNRSLFFGDAARNDNPAVGDVQFRWDGTDLDVLAAANNSVIKWGNGTNSFDQWFYGSSASNYLLWDASANDLIAQDNVSLMFGSQNDLEMRWDGTDFDVLVATDDYAINFGNGTNSPDIKAYGDTASDYALWDASASKLSLSGAAYQQLDKFRRTVAAYTVNHTCAATESGYVFTNTGDTDGVTFTLPAVATSTGMTYKFLLTANATATITAPTDTLVAFNDAAATSLSFSTAGTIIGNAVEVVCDGSKWISEVSLAASTSIPTVTP